MCQIKLYAYTLDSTGSAPESVNMLIEHLNPYYSKEERRQCDFTISCCCDSCCCSRVTPGLATLAGHKAAAAELPAPAKSSAEFAGEGEKVEFCGIWATGRSWGSDIVRQHPDLFLGTQI